MENNLFLCVFLMYLKLINSKSRINKIDDEYFIICGCLHELSHK